MRPALVLAVSLGLLGAAAARAGAQARPPSSPAPEPLFQLVRQAPQSPTELRERLQAAWVAKDPGAYLALWHFADDGQRERETRFAATRFAAEELSVQVRELRADPGQGAFLLPTQVFSVAEPRARLEELIYRLARQPEGYLLTGRDERPSLEGLMHLSLDPQPYRANGIKVTLEDFEIDLQQGSLFTTPAALGPTVVVFVGKGTVRFRPRPAAEQEQLRQYSGRPQLDDGVSTFFLRLHPADFHRVFAPGRLDPDPSGQARLKQAQRVFDENAASSFVLDAPLPRSPWWLMPAVGDASLAFRTRLGTLTYTLSAGEAEGVSLFDREHRRQICLYPRLGREGSYNEDAGRAVDVIAHDLSVRFEPGRSQLQAEDVMRLRLDAAGPTLRLRLHEDLAVQSVSSKEAGEHLFFRIRHQDSLLVSLGELAGRVGEITLTVRYAGVHVPGTVEREVMQRAVVDSDQPSDDQITIENTLIYSNRTAWYPQYDADDYALARLRFDVPAEYMALTGGQQVSAAVLNGRRQVEYVQDRPAKYITVALGRFVLVGRRQLGAVAVEAYGLGRTRREAALVLDDCGQLLPFFEGEFGPFPYPTLRVALIEGITPGGHSPPGMVVLAQRPPMLRTTLRPDPAGFWDVPGFFFAHELAHQWWGHAVAGQNYRERWMSESFAQYAAALWVRRQQGEQEFEEVLERMARWALRTTHQGPISLGYRLGHVRGDPQVYRAIVYDKGACVLHMLRGVVGEEAFRKGLRTLQERFRFQKAGTEDVQRALEEASGRPLGPYFETWIRGTALPRLVVTHHHPGTGTAVEVQVRDLPGPVPLALELSGAGARDVRTVQLPPEGGRWTFEAAARRVEANSDRGLLAWVEER